jgi:Ca2+-binding EF-hand superfamily protein
VLRLQMTEELRQAFRLYDKKQRGFISTMQLKVVQPWLSTSCQIANLTSTVHQS